jgi:hypothetical protein
MKDFKLAKGIIVLFGYPMDNSVRGHDYKTEKEMVADIELYKKIRYVIMIFKNGKMYLHNED